MAEDYFCVLQDAITAGNKKKFEEAVIKGLLDVFRQLEELDALIGTDEDKTKLRGIVSDDLKVIKEACEMDREEVVKGKTRIFGIKLHRFRKGLENEDMVSRISFRC